MPIYEYQCQDCNHQFDEIQKMDATPLVDCPECAQPALVKLVSAPSFRLKGGGWYETDFKKDKRKNLAGDKEGGSSDDGAKKKSDKLSTESSGAKSASGKETTQSSGDSKPGKAAKSE